MSINNWSSISYLFIWPESESLKAALRGDNHGQPHINPSIKGQEVLKDEVAEAIEQLGGQSHKCEERDYGCGKQDLMVLIKQKRLKAAFNLTTKILSLTSQEYSTFEVMEIWNCRFQLLMALKMHKLAFEEMASFGELDEPDTYLQYLPEYRQQKYTGSVVPFNLRLIHAEVPKYSAEMSKAYKRLSRLAENIHLIAGQLASDQRLVWQKRLEAVELSKARLLYTLNDTQNLITLYQQIASRTEDKTRQREIHKMLIKFAAICGNSQLMEQFCHEVDQNNELCRTLKLIFYGKYQEVIDCAGRNKSNSDANANLNNMAVCLLYTGQVKEAVDQLIETPILPLILNLFTIAELAATKTTDLRTQYFVRFSQQFSDMLEPRNLRIIK